MVSRATARHEQHGVLFCSLIFFLNHAVGDCITILATNYVRECFESLSAEMRRVDNNLNTMTKLVCIALFRFL